MQILLRDALRHPWPLNENVPVFDTLSRIGTGSCYLFDLASFGTNVKLKANLVLSDRRHLLPSAALLRTQRATFTALGSSLHKGIV